MLDRAVACGVAQPRRRGVHGLRIVCWFARATWTFPNIRVRGSRRLPWTTASRPFVCGRAPPDMALPRGMWRPREAEGVAMHKGA